MSYTDDIDRVISWYRGKFSAKDATRQNLEYLNAARRKLACSLYDLRNDVADAKAEREKADYNRKKNYADQLLANRAEGLTIVEAESRARLNNSEHEDALCDAIRVYESLWLLYQSVGEILNAMSSDIRTLENEYRRAGQTEPV